MTTISFETWIARVGSALLVLVSCEIVAGTLENPTPVDRSLPMVGLALVVVWAASVGSRFADAISISAPMLLAVAVAVPDGPSRLLGYGLIVAQRVD